MMHRNNSNRNDIRFCRDGFCSYDVFFHRSRYHEHQITVTVIVSAVNMKITVGVDRYGLGRGTVGGICLIFQFEVKDEQNSQLYFVAHDEGTRCC